MEFKPFNNIHTHPLIIEPSHNQTRFFLYFPIHGSHSHQSLLPPSLIPPWPHRVRNFPPHTSTCHVRTRPTIADLEDETTLSSYQSSNSNHVNTKSNNPTKTRTRRRTRWGFMWCMSQAIDSHRGKKHNSLLHMQKISIHLLLWTMFKWMDQLF